MHVGSLTSPNLIFPDVPGTHPTAFLREVAERLEQQGVVADADELYTRLWEREQLGSTGIGSQVAIPHCKVNGIDRVVVAVATSRRGVEFGASDERPVKLFFTVVSPAKSAADHLQSLAAISKWVKADHHVERILEQHDPQAIYELLCEE